MLNYLSKSDVIRALTVFFRLSSHQFVGVRFVRSAATTKTDIVLCAFFGIGGVVKRRTTEPDVVFDSASFLDGPLGY